MAAKQTATLIPLCHPLPLHTSTSSSRRRDAGTRIEAASGPRAQTGVEMEALTAVAVAALTIYDMVKAVDKAMVIGDISLLEKRAAAAATTGASSPEAEARDAGGRTRVRSARPPCGYPRLALILGALTAMGPLAIDMYLPALPTIARELATIDAGGSGQSRRATSSESRSARPFYGPLSDRHRPEAGAVLRAGRLHGLVYRLRARGTRADADRIPFAAGAWRLCAARRASSRRARSFRRARFGPDAVDADARHGPRADPGAAHRRPVAGHISAGDRCSGFWRSTARSG